MKISDNMMRIGILGGSFDPVHLGHVYLAQDAIDKAALDKLIFVPARVQPFKRDRKTASGTDRVNMLKLAVSGNSKMEISLFELNSSEISYTYLTLRYMKELYDTEAALHNKRTKIYFVCGTDSFLKLETWKKADELLDNYAFIIGSRPGYRQEELIRTMDRIRREHGTEAVNITNRLMDISSTDIRARISKGDFPEDLIPAEVINYIKANGLYR